MLCPLSLTRSPTLAHARPPSLSLALSRPAPTPTPTPAPSTRLISGTIKLLAWLLTWPGLCFAVFLSIWRFAYLCCRWLAFPGGLSIHVRNMETDIGKRIAGQMRRILVGVQDAVGIIIPAEEDCPGSDGERSSL